VADLLPDAELDPVAFAALHASAFLLRHGDVTSLKIPEGPVKTMISENRQREGGGRLSHQFLVFPIKDTDRTVSSSFISLGRTTNNDIHIPDVSVSKLHALFTERDGTFYVRDAGTDTGTRVNGEAVPTRDGGDPVELESGDQVEFGGVATTFMKAEEMIGFLKRVS
jgi:hypothetical protein